MPLPPLGSGSDKPSSSLPSGSGGGASLPALGPNGKSGGKKKVRGVLGPVDRAVDTATRGVAGVLMNAITAPQQVIYKTGQGLGDLVQGHGAAGLKGLGGAAGEILSLGQAGGDIDFATAIGDLDETGTRVPRKLPTGVNTTVDILGDPLNFVTFGQGATAKAALKAAGDELAEDTVQRLTRQGLKKGLTSAEKAQLRDRLVTNAAEDGAKNPEKTADKALKQLELRGRGGVTLRIPGTGAGITAMSGETAAKVGQKTGLTAARGAVKTSAPAKFVRKGLIPGASVADAVGSKRASDELLDVIKREQHGEANDVDDLLTRWDAAVRDFGGEKAFKESGADSIVSRALQSGDLEAAKAANPEMARLIDTGDAIRRWSDEGLRSSGALGENQGFDIDTFLHRTRTPEAAKALDGEGDGVLREGRSLSGMNAGSAKSRVVAPDSADHEINEAIRLMQSGEDVPDGLLRDAGRVAEYQAPVRKRIAALEEQAEEIRLKHLDPATGELTAAGKRRIARLEGGAAVRKSIARQLEKRGGRPATTAARRALRAEGAVDETATRLQKQADARLLRNDEKQLAKIKTRTEKLTDQLAEKAKLADDDTRELVENIAQKLPPGTPLYRESAVASLIDSGVDAARAIHTAQMMNGVRAIKDDAGKAILLSAEDVAADAVPAGWVKFDVPKMGTFYAPGAVKAELGQVVSIVGQDDVVKQATKWLKTWDRWWRGQVTASLPGGIPFASRNARTNVMLTFVDGMPPTYFARGGSFQLKVRRIVKNNAAEIADDGVEATMKRHLGDRDFKIWKAARERGVVGDGFYNIDLDDAPALRAAGRTKEGGKLRRGARFVAGSHGTLAVKGREWNQAVEQHARMSHFLYGIDRFGDIGEAAARTNTVLFDYGRRTPFEQKMVKAILPFWTFMRKNLPGQVRGFVENPIRISMPEKLSELTTEPLDEDSQDYRHRRGDRVSKLPGIAGWITTPERPWQAAASSVEPLAQLAATVVPGKQSLDPERGAPQALSALSGTVGGAPLAMLKAIVDEASQTNSFSGGKLTEDEMPQRLLKAAYPQLGRGPTMLAGRLPGSIAERKTKAKAKQPTLAQIAQALGFKLEAPQ